jgi:hypothetical protein
MVLNYGYCINIKQQDLATGAKTIKNINSKDCMHIVWWLDAIKTTINMFYFYEVFATVYV